MLKKNGVTKMMNDVKKPCIGCVYYTACGSTTRTVACSGRVTKSERKKENNGSRVQSSDRKGTM